jgi:hypothetical protein
MKFTKTAIAVAIVGIAAAPMMVSADTTLSGILEIQVQGTDADDVPLTAAPEGDMEVAVGDVLFNIASNHETNSGLTAYSNMRADFNSRSNEGAAQADSVYIGIKGGFGDFRIGETPLAVEYGQVAGDLFDAGSEINGGLSYTGTFGPVGITANFSPENNQEVVGLGGKFAIGGFGIGIGFESRGNGGVDGSAAVAAVPGTDFALPIEAADAVPTVSSETFTTTAFGVTYSLAGASLAATFWTRETAGPEDMENFSIKVGYGIGGVSGALTFATQEMSVVGPGRIDKETVRLDVAYGLGGGMAVSTRITAATDSVVPGNDNTAWRIQLNKAF